MTRKLVRRSVRVGLGMAMVASAFATGPADAAAAVLHVRAAAHREVSTVYYPDDICGSRAGWTRVVVTYRWQYTELPDGSYDFTYVETGTYHTDFDDPAIPSYDSQFTGAQHGTLTRGATQVYTSQWHDFPGSITIHEQVLFVQVGDDVKLDRDDLRVDGCP